MTNVERFRIELDEAQRDFDRHEDMIQLARELGMTSAVEDLLLRQPHFSERLASATWVYESAKRVARRTEIH